MEETERGRRGENLSVRIIDIKDLGEVEVRELDFVAFLDDEIFWFDVAVNDLDKVECHENGRKALKRAERHRINRVGGETEERHKRFENGNTPQLNTSGRTASFPSLPTLAASPTTPLHPLSRI